MDSFFFNHSPARRVKTLDGIIARVPGLRGRNQTVKHSETVP
jgi:hypothetical protein